MGIALQTVHSNESVRLAGCSAPGFGLSPNNALTQMMAGAQARGMADMLEMLSLGAVLVGASGHALHVSARARALLRGQICFARDRIAGMTPEASEGILALLAAAARGEPSQELTLRRGWGREGTVTLVSLPVPEAPSGARQLLQSVVTVKAG